MPNSAQDPGPAVRWFYLTRSGLLLRVPSEGASDPVAWARETPGVLILRRENEVVWRRATDPQCRPVHPPAPSQVGRTRRHLAVVK